MGRDWLVLRACGVEERENICGSLLPCRPVSSAKVRTILRDIYDKRKHVLKEGGVQSETLKKITEQKKRTHCWHEVLPVSF
jgi:hypothetical protein